ncbi:hypothetical protein QQ045_021239 [Rhodiola kirilowii]
MEITELLMMETDYFSSCLDWLQADQWDDSSAGSTGYSSQHLSSRSSVSGANPSPCNSVTNFGDFKVKRIRSRASKKTPTQHLNATAKNFKQLVQKHTGRPTVPRPFTLFGVSSSNPIKGPMTLSFGERNAYCTEQYYENHYFNDCVLENEVGVMYSYSNSPVKPLSPVSGTQLRLQPAGTVYTEYASGFV